MLLSPLPLPPVRGRQVILYSLMKAFMTRIIHLTDFALDQGNMLQYKQGWTNLETNKMRNILGKIERERVNETRQVFAFLIFQLKT